MQNEIFEYWDSNLGTNAITKFNKIELLWQFPNSKDLDTMVQGTVVT